METESYFFRSITNEIFLEGEEVLFEPVQKEEMLVAIRVEKR
jgi:hypothetical protein